jgi:hypothetical protein
MVPAMSSFRSLAPILPTTDMARMQAQYEALGFAVKVHAPGYGTASRDGFNLHFELVEAPVGPGALYLAVSDADALHAEWARAGVGELTDLHDPGFGVWEAALVDADGNILRFGSPLP